MPAITRAKHSKLQATLIIAIDVGTTFSAVSYCISSNKNHLKSYTFQEVNRWPEQHTSNAKIPSILYYDQEGNCRLIGADTENLESVMVAEENGWEKAEWWKLLLGPQHFSAPDEVFPLPYGLTVEMVLKDFLTYIKRNVQDFIVMASSEKYWQDISSSVSVVMTVPSDWEGKTQQRMREAAIQAELVGCNEGYKISFLSEGEAALHYCIDQVSQSEQLRVGGILVVCDAGGGTTDIGIYRVKQLSPFKLEEIASPICFVAGGVFVDSKARQFIKGKLEGSDWDNPDCISDAVSVFEKHAKRNFKGSEEKLIIRLRGPIATDEDRGVYAGKLTIPKDDMISFFEPSLTDIKQGINKMLARESHAEINNLFLVGGFSESPYVFSEIKRWVAESANIHVSKPDGCLSKAIPHGALHWYIDHSVQMKVAKLHYGAETDLAFDPKNPDMIGRKKIKNVLGEWRVRSGWQTIVKKDARVKYQEEHTTWFTQDIQENAAKKVKMELYAYRWDEPPQFFENPDGSRKKGFIHLGTVSADLSTCFKEASFQISPIGKKYKRLNFEVSLSFFEVEIKGRLRWKEAEGKKFKYGEATMAYDT